ncbi:hypothetical protein LWI29_032127 [Acer saccharum]|uniref:Isopenicillin N synthase-like Fe(2+) 2OG dioxygenase domain-containing protein n=1 Tax=Acer saccharum TaxID=4024 RepID=A0AA39S186_ACESA|nr:hypothetical protein LWI29_032127 [Acer saccharum]
MSNGRLKSPWHRVVTQMNVERFSVALFYNPPSRTEIEPEPIEDLVPEDGGFKKVVVSDYLQHLYAISPTKEKQGIMPKRAGPYGLPRRLGRIRSGPRRTQCGPSPARRRAAERAKGCRSTTARGSGGSQQADWMPDRSGRPAQMVRLL